jgi:hypothetical protein
MAHEFNLAVLVIRHPNKDASKPAMYRGGGSDGALSYQSVAFRLIFCEAAQLTFGVVAAPNSREAVAPPSAPKLSRPS